MVPVGVLLLILSVAFGVGFLVAPGESADIQFYGLMLQDLPARNLVILGMITGLIAAAGAESIRWGTARWRRRRRIARKKERELAASQSNASTEASPTAPATDGEVAPVEGANAAGESKEDSVTAKPASDNDVSTNAAAKTTVDDAADAEK